MIFICGPNASLLGLEYFQGPRIEIVIQQDNLH
jgi:hypothetical protein